MHEVYYISEVCGSQSSDELPSTPSPNVIEKIDENVTELIKIVRKLPKNKSVRIYNSFTLLCPLNYSSMPIFQAARVKNLQAFCKFQTEFIINLIEIFGTT